jgi:hypothetical protein
MCYNLTFVAGGGSKTKNKIQMFKDGTIKFIQKMMNLYT